VMTVRIERLRKTFGSTVALDAVDLHVDSGELFFLLGPSGCGKTTLLRAIAGFAEPDAGRIFFGDRDITHLAPHKRNTGMVFQNYALWPHMTVARNVAFGLNARRVRGADADARVAETLRLVEMDEYAARRPNQLSGGQQQRVALARALVIQPDCLLLDEPLSNLDAKLRLGMRAEIRRICKTVGITTIYVTHDQKEALSIADRIAVMFDGGIVQIGTPRQLYEQPATARVAGFIGETNLIPATITKRTKKAVTLELPFGRIEATAGGDLMPDATAALCSIRPEAVQLAPKAKEGFEAAVLERTYLGEVEQMLLSVGEVRLRATVLNPGQVAGAAERVRIRFDPADVLAFAGGEE